MRLGFIPLLLAGLAFNVPTVRAQSATDPAPALAQSEGETEAEPSAGAVPTPTLTAERAAPVQASDYESASPATLTAGITGLAVSVLIGALMM